MYVCMHVLLQSAKLMVKVLKIKHASLKFQNQMWMCAHTYIPPLKSGHKHMYVMHFKRYLNHLFISKHMRVNNKLPIIYS